MMFWKRGAVIRLWLFSLTGLIIWGSNIICAAAQPVSFSELIRHRIETLRAFGQLKIGEAQIASTTILPLLYERKQFGPLWTRPEKINAFIKTIRAIDADGLAPRDYHYTELQGLQAFLERNNAPNDMLRADLDMLLTDALILLENHLIFGKVDPHAFNPNWNFSRDIDDQQAIEVAEALLSADDLTARLELLKPQKPIYAKLKTALARYRAIDATGGWQALPQGSVLKKGAQEERVELLKKRLTAEGDLPFNEAIDNHFDDSLEKAVLQFQLRHGLIGDGAVGERTLAALNIPVADRIDQIRAGLERARWTLHALEERFVLVDIAGFRIFFYDKDIVVWSSRVQVGKPYRKTPVFRDTIRYLEFNPSWTIPPKIARKDILPEVAKDSQYLTRNQIRILDQRGRDIDPESIDFSLYANGETFPYILTQDPGPNNALGVAKFMFPNAYHVYLHDTPEKKLFSLNSRPFSSGCIRVEKPLELAERLLDDPEKWNRQKIQEAVTSQKTHVIYLKNPVPVLMLYSTVEVDDNGMVCFKEDIYKRDMFVIQGLKANLVIGDGPSRQNSSSP